MSRSRKHFPICGNGSGSEKKDKRFANRALRRIVKTILCKDSEVDILPGMKDISNPWSFSKDGKHWFGYLKEGRTRTIFGGQRIVDPQEDLILYTRLMRK